MANELKTAASYTDGSARVVNYRGDPKGTDDTNVELVLAWPNIDANKSKSLLDAKNNTTKIDDIHASGQDWGDDWYVAEQPIAQEDDARQVTIVVVLTKATTLTGKSFPYEDMGISAYDSVHARTFTATREIFRNRTTAPTSLASDELGVLRYIKNPYGRFDGFKMVQTNAVSLKIGDNREFDLVRSWLEKTTKRPKEQTFGNAARGRTSTGGAGIASINSTGAIVTGNSGTKFSINGSDDTSRIGIGHEGDPYEGFYWRNVWEWARIKLSSTSNGARVHVEGHLGSSTARAEWSLSGSYVKYLQSSGIWYAERIVRREVGIRFDGQFRGDTFWCDTFLTWNIGARAHGWYSSHRVLMSSGN